ncbi:MAG: PIG-L family deacetylase [Clostridia bacterium]|nr:PIG-L family deacetylase [Clostridia bacterium]
MEFLNKNANVYYISGDKDLSKTTHLCISAHQDDVEIMAYSQIYECFNDKNKHFTAVNTTNGSGSPRTGKFADYTDEQMVQTRIQEQITAGKMANYHSLIMMMYPSKEIKDFNNRSTVEDLKSIILETKPEVILTHNLMDKHSTHVATCVKVIEALRELKDVYKPKQVIGLEVWRSLDWLSLKDKLCFDTSKNKKLEKDILTVFESQVVGGKRYDLATIGRRLANATFFESHNTDQMKSMNYGVDLTEFVYSDKNYIDFVNEKLDNFKNEVVSLLEGLIK